jgi:spore germination protein
MTIYVVKKGDTLWSIAKKFNVDSAVLSRINGRERIQNLVIGESLVIPTLSRKYGSIYSNGFIEPSTAAIETRVVRSTANYLTYISPFSYMVSENGDFLPFNDNRILAEARRFNVSPIMVITNFKGGTFDTQLASRILSSNQITQRIINNTLVTMRQKGYKGVTVDFERIAAGDRIKYNQFLQRLKNALTPYSYELSTALAPKTSALQAGEWYEGHDYNAHGRIADYVILMTYEWGWSGGPPMPVAPINQVRKVLDYAVREIPANKIMMGMPLYGYDWRLPYVKGGPFAERLSPQQAILRAIRYSANVQYDNAAKAPFIRYYDRNGNEHIIWFEDARSAYAKYNLVIEYKLKGVSYWELGLDFPQNFYIIRDMFTIMKK